MPQHILFDNQGEEIVLLFEAQNLLKLVLAFVAHHAMHLSSV